MNRFSCCSEARDRKRSLCEVDGGSHEEKEEEIGQDGYYWKVEEEEFFIVSSWRMIYYILFPKHNYNKQSESKTTDHNS